MGKKQQGLPKSQSYGVDISKFFDKRPAGQQAAVGSRSKQKAGRSSNAAAQLPILDNTLLSQDDEAQEVVWAPLPGSDRLLLREEDVSQSEHRQLDSSCSGGDHTAAATTTGNNGAGAAAGGGSQKVSGSQKSQNSKDEIKKSLIQVVQKTGAAAAGGGSKQASHSRKASGSEGTSDVLDMLLAGGSGPSTGSPQKKQAASTLRGLPREPLAGGAALGSHQPPALPPLNRCSSTAYLDGPPVLGGQGGWGAAAAAAATAAADGTLDEGDAILNEVLAAADSISTPCPQTKPRGPRHMSSVGAFYGGCGGSSSGGIARHRARAPSTTQKRNASGQKRKALLELLDQVELMVKARSTADDEGQGQGQGQPRISPATHRQPVPMAPLFSHAATPGSTGKENAPRGAAEGSGVTPVRKAKQARLGPQQQAGEQRDRSDAEPLKERQPVQAAAAAAAVASRPAAAYTGSGAPSAPEQPAAAAAAAAATPPGTAVAADGSGLLLERRESHYAASSSHAPMPAPAAAAPQAAQAAAGSRGSGGASATHAAAAAQAAARAPAQGAATASGLAPNQAGAPAAVGNVPGSTAFKLSNDADDWMDDLDDETWGTLLANSGASASAASGKAASTAAAPAAPAGATAWTVGPGSGTGTSGGSTAPHQTWSVGPGAAQAQKLSGHGGAAASQQHQQHQHQQQHQQRWGVGQARSQSDHHGHHPGHHQQHHHSGHQHHHHHHSGHQQQHHQHQHHQHNSHQLSQHQHQHQHQHTNHTHQQQQHQHSNQHQHQQQPIGPATAAACVPPAAAPAPVVVAPPPPAPGLVGGREEANHVVLEVEDLAHEKRVKLFNEYQGSELTVHLRQAWADTPLQPGDCVNIIVGSLGSSSGGGPPQQQHRIEEHAGSRHLVVDSSSGLLVLHPDILLSGTTIMGAMRCPRQAWLQERTAGSSNDKAVIGQLLHELVQRALSIAMQAQQQQQAQQGQQQQQQQQQQGPGQAAPLLDRQRLAEEARAIVAAAGEKLLEVGLEELQALKQMEHHASAIVAWVQTYVGGAGGAGGVVVPRQDAVLDMGPNARRDAPTRVCVQEVVDIEENIWAPRYGLKGQIDASLAITLATTDPMHNQTTLTSCWGGGTGGGTSSTQQPPGSRRWQGHSSAPSVSASQPQRAGPSGRHTWGPGGQAAAAGAAAQQQQQQFSSSGQVLRTLVSPLEFKSGKAYIGHRAQVLLYLLLMSERYEQPVDVGLLWNIQTPGLQAVKHAHGEIASLMGHRNRLASYLAGAVPRAPPMLHDDFTCSRCPVAATCALYHKAVEGGTAESSGLGPSFHALTSHLYPSHAAFFAHWTRLLDLEEAPARAAKPQMWAMGGDEREGLGAALAGLKLQEYRGVVDSPGGPRHCYALVRHASGSSNNADRSAGASGEGVNGGSSPLDSIFSTGDMALMGIEGRHTALARITIGEVTKTSMCILSKKEIQAPALGFASSVSQQPQLPPQPPPANSSGQAMAAMPPPPAPSAPAVAATTAAAAAASAWSGVRLRLDKDEASSTFAAMRTALVDFMDAGCSESATQSGRPPQVAARLRQLVIDLEAPQWQRMESGQQSQADINSYLSQARCSMNGDQVEAVRKVLEMRDYAMVLGMPGTGKTTTIVHTIQALLASRPDLSILLTSYTNSAVDNILVKMAEQGINFVRLGHVHAVHPAVQQYTPGGTRYPDTSTAGLKALGARVRVFACTCLSARHPLLARRMFDVCIVDEASQISMPAILGPLTLARTFVLVGDHYQLSPLVANPAAAAAGYGVSLFRRLSEAHPQAVVALRQQYRMAADIMALSNELVYGGALACGSPQVAGAVLRLPRWGCPELKSGPSALPAWLQQALDPARRVVFVDTEGVPGAREQLSHDTVSNPAEADLVKQLVAGMLAAGGDGAGIGLVSPYKAQVSLLLKVLTEVGAPVGAEALTIDRYQGRDKPLVVLSFVRSNTERSAGRLLADWQRINVAITRAKHKLVMIGSGPTLASVPLMARMLEMVDARGWRLRLADVS